MMSTALVLMALPFAAIYLKLGATLAKTAIAFYMGIVMVVSPYLMQYQSGSFHKLMIAFVGGAMVLLSLLSVYQDKRRFADNKKPVCALDKFSGSCRNSALWTGLISFILAMTMFGGQVSDLLSSSSARATWKTTVVVMGILGTWKIISLMKAGGPSDLRGLTEEQKCEKNRIMKDGERALIHFTMAVLGIFATWQSVMSKTFAFNGPTTYTLVTAWWKYIRDFVVVVSNKTFVPSRQAKLLAFLKVMSPLVSVSIINYTKTFQQYVPASSVGLPDCFN